MSESFKYSTGIKITFDKPISTDPTIIAGEESTRIPVTDETLLFSSGSNGSDLPVNAFDADPNNYWRSSSYSAPVWIGYDFGKAVSLNKIRTISLLYRPRAFKVQGSSDGSEWTDVASGELLDNNSWQEISFSDTEFRYWRLYYTTLYSVPVRVYGIEFYGNRTTYSSNGFTVAGLQYETSPDGSAEAHNFTIRKVEKTEDNLSIIIWLDLLDRLKYPVSSITVSYDQAIGNLSGALSAQVESFSGIFTPGNLTKMFNPNLPEKIDLQLSSTITLMKIYYMYYKEEEFISVSLSSSHTIIHVDDIID